MTLAMEARADVSDHPPRDFAKELRTLEARARGVREDRDAFLRELASATPHTAAQRTRWALLEARREVVELELEVLDLEKRRAEELAAAARTAPVVPRARYAGREAGRHTNRAAELAEQLAGKRYALVAARANATSLEALARG